MDTESLDFKIIAVPKGGITSPAGIRAAGIHAGFRRNPERLDYAFIAPDEPCAAAGVFTTNRFCAAPVQVSRAHLGGADRGYGTCAGISINSGYANAATVADGFATANETCKFASQILAC